MTALVTLVEAKSQLRVDHADDDAHITFLTEAASAACINYVHRETPWTAEDIPDDAKVAVLLTINWFYDDRAPGKPDEAIAMGYLPKAVTALLHRHRDPALA